MAEGWNSLQYFIPPDFPQRYKKTSTKRSIKNGCYKTNEV